MSDGLAHIDSLQDEVVYRDVRSVIEAARRKVAVAVNSSMVEAYWEIGRLIYEATGERVRRNSRLLIYLSERLTTEFGRGFDERNLQHMRKFYLAFPNPNAMRTDISWTHYRHIIACDTQEERDWYMNAAAENGWSTRELDHQIQTRSYWRLISTQKKQTELPERLENKQIQQSFNRGVSPDEVFKDPYVFDFLPKPPRLESELEQALINSLQEFLLELGQGFTFFARQKRVSFGADDYYIDLVLYNFQLDCFVLIDLKTHEVTPQDVGQMDFYVRIFDDQYKPERGNPTIGLVLGTSKGAAVAKYTALADARNLYAAGYTDHLPSEEELEHVLERNRRAFELAGEMRALERGYTKADNDESNLP